MDTTRIRNTMILKGGRIEFLGDKRGKFSCPCKINTNLSNPHTGHIIMKCLNIYFSFAIYLNLNVYNCVSKSQKP